MILQYTSCKPPINGIFCKESILTELASSAVNHQFLKKRWRGHPELTRSLWLWFSKTKGLMQQRNCKKHPEVSAPVHISADRTPLMTGGGAQSSVSLKWLDLVCSHFMTHPFFNIKTKQIVFEAKVLKVIFCIFLQTDQNPFSVIKRFLLWTLLLSQYLRHHPHTPHLMHLLLQSLLLTLILQKEFNQS